MSGHSAENDAGSDCTCPKGFGGAFRFHRHPCLRAGSVDTYVTSPEGGAR